MRITRRRHLLFSVRGCFGAWACESCGQVNYETRQTCERCGAAKP